MVCASLPNTSAEFDRIARLVLTHSLAPHHDLTILLSDAVAPHVGETLTAEVAAHYGRGCKYLIDPRSVLPALRTAMTSAEEERFSLLEHFSAQEVMPPFKIQRELCDLLVRVPQEYRKELIVITSTVAPSTAVLKQARELISQFVGALPDEHERRMLVALSGYTRAALEYALPACSSILLRDRAHLAEHLPDIEHGDIERLTQVVFGLELRARERDMKEKDLTQLREDFLVREISASRVPSAPVLDRVIERYREIQNLELQMKTLSMEQLRAELSAHLPSEADRANSTAVARHQVHFFAATREIFFRLYGVRPFNTQIIATLLLNETLLDPSRGVTLEPVRGVYEQVKTGEGKSLIIAMQAAYLATYGRRVDVVTSNDYLAGRDARALQPFFKACGLTAGQFKRTSGEKEPGARLLPQDDAPKPYELDILYTTNEALIFTYLNNRLEAIPFMGNRRLDVVIVDEADNLWIDLGDSPCRIASRIEPLFSEEELRKILALVEQKISQKSVAHVYAHLGMFADEFLFGEPALAKRVPRSVVELYFRSAISVLDRENAPKLNVDYVITEEHGKPKITLVDKGVTGRLKARSQWDLGIHEFVTLREGLKLPTQRGTAAQLSHIEYLRMYKNLFAVSGTFGEETDRRYVESTFGLRGVDIPAHHKSQRRDAAVRVVPARAEWKKALVERVRATTAGEKPRAAIVIASTIKNAREIRSALEEAGLATALLDDHENTTAKGLRAEEQEIIAAAGAAGARTVATDVLGRGADIRPSEDCLACGGLHSILAEMPKNLRVEQQARGRAGRQGRPGSSEILACTEEDLFFNRISDSLRTLIAAAARTFGESSRELQATVQFARGVATLNHVVGWAAEQERDKAIVAGQEYYFRQLERATRAFEQQDPSLQDEESNEILGNVIALKVKRQWTTMFHLYTLELRRVSEQAYSREASNRSSATPPTAGYVAEVERIFTEAFGFPSSELETRISHRGFRLALADDLKTARETIAELAFRVKLFTNLFQSPEIAPLARRLKGQVDALFADMPTLLTAKEKGPPRAGSDTPRRGRKP